MLESTPCARPAPRSQREERRQQHPIG
jgi:hypothetical protein